MDRRALLKLLAAASAAVATRDVWVPERRFFLPPPGGWVAPSILRPQTDRLIQLLAANDGDVLGLVELIRPSGGRILSVQVSPGGSLLWRLAPGEEIVGPVLIRLSPNVRGRAIGKHDGDLVSFGNDGLPPLRARAFA